MKTKTFITIILLLFSISRAETNIINDIKGKTISITSNNGIIKIRGEKRDNIEIKSNTSFSKSTTNDKVIIDFKDEKENLSIKNISGELFINSKTPDINLDSIKAVLTLKSKSGNVKFNDYEGVIDVDMISGNFKLNNIKGKSSFKIISGNFSADSLMGIFSASTSVGNFNLKNLINSSINIDTKTGDFALNNFKSCDKIDISTNIGDMIFKNISANKIYITSKSGNIDIDKTTADYNINLSIGDITLNYIDLRQAKSYISLNSGNIYLALKNKEEYNYSKAYDKTLLKFPKEKFLSKSDMKIYKNNKELDITLINGDIIIK